ncbi:MAG: AAA domain-containing protein [Bacteroidia bacterium]|nr:AAA domain-containing protein [Bacteroidia bacterium]
MHPIIHSYKLRLTNLSQSNRSLKLARLSKSRDIDLKDLGFLEEDSAEDILLKIIAGKDVRLISKLDSRHEPVNLADRRLNHIYRSVRTLFEETGTYDLFVGYPFVEGKFIDGSVARCPVLLFPVRLLRNLQSRPRWKLEVVEDEPVVFNKTFFLAYEQFQQVRLRPEFWEEEIEPNKDGNVWINDLYQKIKSYEIEVNFNSSLFDLKLESFPDYLAEAMNRFGLGKLIFRPQAVLGIFPQSDSSLLQDYQEIEKKPETFDLTPFFSVAMLPVFSETYIREEDRYFVTPVDESQEAALLTIKQGKSLVIHGPPGTGKSQVIVNIIADAMAHGKKVLLVSQKRAALDVVYKRLESIGLGRFAVLIHDYRQDRTAIYRKIKQQIDDIPVFEKEMRDLNRTKWEHDYKILSREADQLSRDFDQLYEALTSRMDCGMSMHELYLKQDSLMPPLPLREVAGEMDQTKLRQFREKLAGLLDYAEFFREDYPWRERISFRNYSYDDRDRLRRVLTEIPEAVTALHKLWLELDKDLGENLFQPEINRQNISYFNQINQLLYTPQIREDVEAIFKDELDETFIRKKFEQIGGILTKMDTLKYLKDFHWRLFSDLKKHVENYKKLKNKTLRFLSLDFLRARWFLRKWLEEKNYVLDEPTFEAVKEEFKLFSRLHWHYARIFEKTFFSDFPLLDNLKEKHRWIERKQKHFGIWKQIVRQTEFPRLKPRFSFGKLDESHWQATMQKVAKLERFTQFLNQNEDIWKGFFHKNQLEKLKQGILNPAEYSVFNTMLLATFDRDFAEIKSLDGLLGQLSLTEQKAFELLRPTLVSVSDEKSFLQNVENSFFYFWIEAGERRCPILAEVSNRSWARKTEDYDKKLQERRTKVAELIRRRLLENILGNIEYNRLKNRVTYRTIYHQVNKKRLLWSARKLVSAKWKDGLSQLMPCWMASPESIAAIFPMEKDFFDVIVFDEASQCFVERAIPVMLRGKQNVIAGDDKQLQPLDLYKVRYDDSEESFLSDEIALEVESVLDLAKTTFEESHLTWHYRSQEEELINFSNHAFYEGKLQVVPPARPGEFPGPPLEWIPVQGEWRNNQNPAEARRVVELILSLIQHPAQPSLGIVTFNYFQQELIRDLLDEKLEELATTDEKKYAQLYAAMHKTEQEEFQGIFVKNIENVQGDERDIILFSIGYARNENGKLVTHFGLLNQKGGENRLNVAITRARLKSYIVCSFLPGELNVEAAINDGPRFLKSYLQYARSISDGWKKEILNPQNGNVSPVTTENPIADFLGERLRQLGYGVVRNVGDTSWKLDIAIKREDGVFLLGIECEGSFYFSGSSSKEREIYRRNLLESRGWKVHRVWARNFWADREKEVEKVVAILK